MRVFPCGSGPLATGTGWSLVCLRHLDSPDTPDLPVVSRTPHFTHTFTHTFTHSYTHSYTHSHTHTTYNMHTHTCIHVHTYIVKIYLENSYVFHKHVRSQKGIYAYVCSNIIGKEYFLYHVEKHCTTGFLTFDEEKASVSH